MRDKLSDMQRVSAPLGFTDWVLGVVFALLLFTIGTHAGMRDFTDFSVFESSENVLPSDSITLDIARWLMVKIYGDAAPGGTDAYAGAVTNLGYNQFRIYWATPGELLNEVRYRDLTLLSSGFDDGTPVTVFDLGRPDITYLHAASGAQGSVCSFVDLNSAGTLWAVNGTNGYNRTEIITGSTPYHSLCWFAADTFLVTHRVGNSTILLRKIRSLPAGMVEIDHDTVASDGTNENSFRNMSVTADSVGRILVTYSRGGVNPPNDRKDLFYALYRRDLVKLRTGIIDSGVSVGNEYTYWDDGPVTAYTVSRFAAAHWASDGVYLDTIVTVGAVPDVQSVRIAEGTGVRGTAIARNENFLVVAWKGNLFGNPTASVEGVRFPIRNNGIQIAEVDTFTFSDPSESIETSVPDLTLAMDSVGSIAATWPRPGTGVGACAWANRPIRHANGVWISQVDSVPMNEGDSVVFKPGTMTMHGQGTAQPYLRVGPPLGESGDWSAWVPLGSQTELQAHTLGTSKYFQLKVELARGVDSLKTPVFTGLRAVWNVKPKLTELTGVRVNRIPSTGTVFGDTLKVFSRADTVGVSFSSYDPDTGDMLYVDIAGLTAETIEMNDTAFFYADALLGALPTSDTTYRMMFSLRDSDGWYDRVRSLYVQTKNMAPEVDVRVAWDSTGTGALDTLEISGASRNIFLGPVDSVVVLYTVDDENDADTRIAAAMNSDASSEVLRNELGRLVLPGNSFSGGTDSVRIWTGDPDTSLEKTIYFRRNEPPHILDVEINTIPVSEGDLFRFVPGRTNRIRISAFDENETHWDTLTYRLIASETDTLLTDGSLECSFGRTDDSVTIIVHDIAGAADTVRFALIHRWFSLDSAENRGLGRAKDTLLNHVSVIVGSGDRDTVIIPYHNFGTDTVRILSLNVAESAVNWLQLGLMNSESGAVAFYERDNPSGLLPIHLAPKATVHLCVMLNSSGLTGDGVATDTIRIATDDPLHTNDALAVHYEHNELPVLAGIDYSYEPRTPFWLTKSRSTQGYRFPPHAAVRMTFSEPIDSVSVVSGIRLYSALDSASTGTPSEIPLTHQWEQGYTSLAVKPAYTKPSTYFSGILPPPGMFIPTDSLILVLSSKILDQAQTRHGPNGLDVDRDARRDIEADTSIGLRVDSAQFSIVNVSPAASDTITTTKPDIVLEFSSIIWPGSIDTSKTANKTMIVTSAYYSGNDQTRSISFDSVYIQGTRATFVPSKRFFYGDQVTCRYRGYAARDTLGYPVDNNDDGIPIGFLDSAARDDDVEWTFRVNDIRHAERYPGDEAGGIPRDLTIRLQYNKQVLQSVLDTSLVGNRTLEVTSRDSRGELLVFDSVAVDSISAVFRVARRLNYGDSVHCRLHGLSTQDTGEFFFQSESGAILYNEDQYDWNFDITELELVEVSPDSAAVISAVEAPITMTFSGPVTPDLFHLVVDERLNKSFSLRSRFGKGANLPFRDIALSEDGRKVTVYPVRKFFGNDSVHCAFHGFPLGASYSETVDPFLQDSLELSGGYEWHFLTSGVEFYTFPNPFRSSDRRHFSQECCRGTARDLGRCREIPCGVVFKNLHGLRKGINDIRVRIFNMNAHLVFDSETARASDNPGIPIHFDEADSTSVPEWTWYTKNTAGDPVASGVYLYMISDKKDGKNLLKGKIIIVR